MALLPATKGIYYNSFLGEWAKIEAVYGGDSAIKNAATLYLPQLTGQSKTEYDAYLTRGCFFNAFARTTQGLSGAITRKEPVIETIPRVEEVLSSVSLANESVQEVIKITVDNVLQFGYFGILVDMPVLPEGAVVNKDPYFAMYPASTILNFRTRQEGSETKLELLCLAEVAHVQDSENRFNLIAQERVRVLEIIDNALIVKLYKKEQSTTNTETWSQEGDDIIPKIKGKPIDFIPFVFFGAISNNPIPTSPPLIDLADLNIKHWQVSTDYYHGLHYCALPTPWAAGFAVGTNLYIGAMKAWVSENPEARCGYLEFSGEGLGAIEKALSRLEAQMAIMGARMLEEQKKAAEAADTVRMRYSGDTATLSSIVTSVEQGMIKAIDLLGLWMGIDTMETEVHLNRDFVAQKLEATDITALLQSWQAGAISLDTFLYNLQVGEVLSADTTIEDEKAKVEEEKNKNFENKPPNPFAALEGLSDMGNDDLDVTE
jgi:hypothetical protein